MKKIDLLDLLVLSFQRNLKHTFKWFCKDKIDIVIIETENASIITLPPIRAGVSITIKNTSNREIVIR